MNTSSYSIRHTSPVRSRLLPSFQVVVVKGDGRCETFQGQVDKMRLPAFLLPGRSRRRSHSHMREHTVHRGIGSGESFRDTISMLRIDVTARNVKRSRRVIPTSRQVVRYRYSI